MAESSDLAPGKFQRGKHPNSLAALRAHKSESWQSGQSGNPDGRPPGGPMITPALRRFAGLSVTELFRLDLNGLSVAECIAHGYLLECIQSGFDKSRAEVIERLDGRVKETKEIGGNVTVTIVRDTPQLGI